MIVEFPLWIDLQAAIASAFMVPSMMRVARLSGKHPTARRLAQLMALHGLFGAVLFAAFAYIASLQRWHVPDSDWVVMAAIYFTWFSSVALMGTKSAIAWLGEHYGTTRLWWAYVAVSAAWAAAWLIW